MKSSTFRPAQWSLRTMTIVAISAALGGCVTQPMSDPAVIELRLIETTDLHAYVHGFDYFSSQPTEQYGLTYAATLIEEARRENPNHLLIDNGDLIQGSSLGDWAAKMGPEYIHNNNHPIIAALNHLNYDVANLGNHEFNFGLEFLQATLESANFPFVSGNVFVAASAEESGMQQGDIELQQPLVDPYIIQRHSFTDTKGERHELKVGFIGFLPPQIMNWDRRHLEGYIRVHDIVEAANYYIPQMQAEGADVIVAIPHSGLQVSGDYSAFAEQATVQLAQVAGVDAILFGHQHHLFPGSEAYADIPGVDNENGLVHGVPAVQPGFWGSHIGVIDLNLTQTRSGWSVTGSSVATPAIDGRRHKAVEVVVEEAHQATVEWLNEPLMELATPIRNYFAKVGPDLSVQWINQVQQEHGLALQRLGQLPADLPVISAAAPFRNGGLSPQNYTNIEPGKLTRANLSDLYLYPNTVQVVRLNGHQIRDWLEMSARIYQQIQMNPGETEYLLQDNVASYNFDVLNGVTYELQPHYPARFNGQGEVISHHHRVYNLRYQGELIGADDEFLVVTNNYRANGGGNFPHLDGSTVVYDGAYEIRDLLADAARGLGEQHPNGYAMQLEQNWHLVLPRGAKVWIRSSPSQSAQQEAARLRDVRFLRVGNDGFGHYQILP